MTFSDPPGCKAMISPKIAVTTPTNTIACHPVAAENPGGSCGADSSGCIDHTFLAAKTRSRAHPNVHQDALIFDRAPAADITRSSSPAPSGINDSLTGNR